MAEDNIKEAEKELAEQFEDTFAKFFSDDTPVSEDTGEEEKKPKTRKRRVKGPDILAVSDTPDEGMTINEVVAVEPEKQPESEPLKEAKEAMAEEAKTDEPIKKSSLRQGRPRRTHKYATAVGGVLVALAVVGFITVISGIVFGIKSIASDEKQKEEFEWKIYPLLMLDPATFEDPMQLDELFLLKTCMWQTVLENRTTYTYDENMMLIVPASDLDVSAKKLFGDGVKLNHQTFSDGYEYFYIYDEANDSYMVPVSTQTAGYTPKIVKMAKEGNTYTLIAGYVPPTSLWNMSEDGTKTEEIPEKYMYYIIEKTEDKNYIIKAVRDIPKDELPSDLEVASQFALNQGAAYNYDEVYDDYMNADTESDTDIESDTNVQTETNVA